VIDLSILVCSVHTRYETFGREIQRQIWSQYDSLPQQYKDRIEIQILTDNKQMMLGEKRNIMVDAAQGKYVQFIDDDDRISSEMFKLVLDATESDADVITFLAEVSMNSSEPKICRYSIDFAEDQNTESGYERLPNHICAVKKSLAVKSSFPNILYGEDSAYSKLLLPHLKTEHFINKVLYFYDYNDETTETQYHRTGGLRTKRADPVVDVVMLSNSDTQLLQEMTQTAINSCISGANSLPVNVIVLEQQEGVEYTNALTIHAPEEFNYNVFMNRGAKYGQAPWILAANNDLIFTDGWLHHLLAANHPIVSPKCPSDLRQTDVVENTMGDVCGRHFGGWCFMISRELWKEIGGFDTDVSFWFSDNCVIEQVKSVGVLPMLVPKSIVHHLRSMTLMSREDQDSLTWGQVESFNQKYHQEQFLKDSRYQEWRKSQK